MVSVNISLFSKRNVYISVIKVVLWATPNIVEYTNLYTLLEIDLWWF